VSNVSPTYPNGGWEKFTRWLKFSLFPGVDWRSMISGSELPDQVQLIVTRVVSESRLSRVEKTQVAEELLCHFEDGNQRGKSFFKLIDDFGDPATAASLIRISKLRNRSMMSKLFRGGMRSALVGVVCYTGLAAFFHMGTPNVSVDYLVDFNRGATSVAESDKAWNVYRDVWAKYEFIEAPGGHFKEIYTTEEDGSLGDLVKPSDGEFWDIAKKKLADSEDLLESFRVGGVMPAHGLVLQSDPNKYSPEDRAALYSQKDPNEPFDNSLGLQDVSPEADRILGESIIGVLLPHVQTFRNVARILTVDTRWAMEQGDTERATRNIEAIFGMGYQATEAPCLVCSLVGVAVHGIGYGVIDESMADGRFDEFDAEQLMRIQTAVAKYSINDMVKLEGERLMINDVVQRTYSDDGNGDGRITPVGYDVICNLHHLFQMSGEASGFENHFVVKQAVKLAGPVSLLTMATRKQVTDKSADLMDEIESRFDIPMYLDDMSDLEEEIAEIEQVSSGYMLLSQLLPAHQQCRSAMFRTIANQGGVEMAIAAYRYQKENGQFPPSSEALVGEYLDAIPTDQLNGEPLNYKLTDEGFQVYSVGFDLDDDDGQAFMVTDDGELAHEDWDESDFEAHGVRPQKASEYWRMDHGPDHVSGDWVIWPRYAD